MAQTEAIATEFFCVIVLHLFPDNCELFSTLLQLYRQARHYYNNIDYYLLILLFVFVNKNWIRTSYDVCVCTVEYVLIGLVKRKYA